MNPEITVNLAWWNVGISPAVAGEKREDCVYDLWSGFLFDFDKAHQFDVLALCEVSSRDVELLQRDKRFFEFEIHDFTRKSGKSRFDICVLNRKSKLILLREEAKIVIKNGRTFKIGQYVCFGLLGYGDIIHFMFSHWPSRLRCPKDSPERDTYGIRLRDVFNEIICDDQDAYFIFAGDYNDEPYDKSIADHLMATRDKSLAIKKSSLLYNPFWRFMSSGSFLYGSGVPFGTYFHRKGEGTKWRTFDQFIFSSSFVRDGLWRVDESAVSILDYPPYLERVLDRSTLFDHLPIVAKICRRS